MPTFSNAFLISSPLQAVVVDALLCSEPGLDREGAIIFVEDERFVDFFEGLTCVTIRDTRLDGRRQIAENLRSIDGYLSGEVTLWVSDILWPMNNALYTHLKREGRLRTVNFFDEGMVLYWQEQLTRLNRVREWVKFRVLGRKLGLRFTPPPRAPFYGNALNGKVYALHPEFLSNAELVRPLELDLDRVGRMAAQLNDATGSATALEGAALVLSQPYYRVAEEDDFALVVAGLARHLRDSGHERLYVKLHPSEGASLFDRYYRDHGFEIAFPEMKGPVEIVLRSFPASCTLASYNSSALLNARKFGFKGRSVSYGLNWVATKYPIQRNLFSFNTSLLEQADVSIVRH